MILGRLKSGHPTCINFANKTYVELDCWAKGETAGGGLVLLQIGAADPDVPVKVLPLTLLPVDPAFPVPPDATPDVETLKSGFVALERSLRNNRLRMKIDNH